MLDHLLTELEVSPDPPTRVRVGILSRRRKRFILSYCNNLSATKAAKEAGYSHRTAGVIGHELLKIPEIRVEIDTILAEQRKKLEISPNKVLQELAKIAYQDVRKLFAADGSLLPIAQLDDNSAAAVAGVDVEKLYQHFAKGGAEERGTVTKIRTRDSVAALGLLARHLKLLTDKIEITEPEAIVRKLQEGRARVAAMKR